MDKNNAIIEPHDPFADGRRIMERVEQWKKDNPTPPKSADAKSTEKRRKAAFTKVKGPALRKGTKIYYWNGSTSVPWVVAKVTKKYVYVNLNNKTIDIERETIKYQVRFEYTGTKSKEIWRWNVPESAINLVAVSTKTAIEGDWERTYDYTGKCVSVRLLTTFWFLIPVHKFLTEQGYTVTEDEAISLQDMNEHDWVATYYWFWGTCHEWKELGAEVIKWMVGPLKELLSGKVGESVVGKTPIGGGELKTLKFPARDFGKMVAAVYDKKITPTMGKEVLTRMYLREEVEEILKDDKYKISSGDDMIEFVRKVIEDNPEQVADLKEGKDKILGWLVGQVMKESKGKANAGEVNKMFREELGL